MKTIFSKNVTRRFIALLGIIAVLAIIVCSFAACKQDADDDGDKKPVTIPEELRGTTWLHRNGDSVSFTKDSVTVKPKTGAEQTYKIKRCETVKEVNMTTLFFSKEKIADYIVLRDHVITSVNLGGVNQSNFKKNTGSGYHETVELNGMTFEYSTEYAGFGVTKYSGTDKEVTIPSMVNDAPVTYIKSSLSFPDGVFKEKELTKVAIPNSVTSIGDRAFASNQLTSITIPNGVTYIGDYAFSYNQLTSVTIPNSVTSIGNWAFSDNQLTSVTIPNSVTSIGHGAFSDNQLTSVTIPNSITSINVSVFSGNRLTSVTIPNSVTNISNHAFIGNQLTSVTIGNSVISIGNSAFSGNQLTSVTIPNSVMFIGDCAFNSDQLNSVTIGANVTLEVTSSLNYFYSKFANFYNTNGKAAGTYTRPTYSNEWTKQ